MRSLLAVTAVFVTTFAWSAEPAKEPARLVELRSELQKKLDQIDAEAAKAREAHLLLHVDSLKALLEERTKAGDLDGAIAVRAEIEKAGRPAAPTGRVVVYYGPGKSRTYEFSAKKITYLEYKMDYKIKLLPGGMIEAKSPKGDRDRWRFIAGSWVVENFNPGELLPFAVGFVAVP